MGDQHAIANLMASIDSTFENTKCGNCANKLLDFDPLKHDCLKVNVNVCATSITRAYSILIITVMLHLNRGHGK